MELGSNDWLGKLFFGRKKQLTRADPEWPDWYLHYFESFSPYPEETLYDALELIIFDTEATGLDPKQDRMISIGALKLRGNRMKPDEVFSMYMNPIEARHKTEAVVIHGLVPDSEQRTYHPEAEVLAAFLDYLGNSVLVAHHLHFDLALVNNALKRCGAGPVLNQGIDTVNLARRLQPSGYWSPQDVYTLDAQAKRHNITTADRHTAVGDSYITALLLMKQVNKLGEIRQRPVQLDDLLG